MNEVELLGEVTDGKYIRANYRYRAHEFTIERKRRTWWCHGGISVPIRERAWFQSEDEVWESWCIGHETGFSSQSRKSILKKIRKAIDDEIRKDLAKEQLRTSIP